MSTEPTTRPAEAPGDVLRRLGVNGAAWAAEFVQLHTGAVIVVDSDKYPGLQTVSQYDLLTWFANAIEAGRTAGYGEAKREHIPGWPAPARQAATVAPGTGYCGYCGRGGQ